MERMSLQEFELSGGCEGCMFYGVVDFYEEKLGTPNADSIKYGCLFHWFDDESDDWDYGKNCDIINS